MNLCLFLLPGVAIAALATDRHTLQQVHALVLIVVSSATLGYLAFWIYFESKLLGQIFSYFTIALSLALVGRALKTNPQFRQLIKNLCLPFVYFSLAGLCYLCLFYLFVNPFLSGADVANVRFFQQGRPGDNLIPLFFAQKIYDHQPLSPICCGDWLSSDRPPLQAGIFLLQRPLRFFGNTGLQYQTLATGLQCLWICGIWAFLIALRASPRQVKQVLSFLIFSGFLFFNSVYVWPKLLAAAFLFFAASLLLQAFANRRSLTNFESVLAAVSFSLAILAHPGSVFSAPAFLLLLIANHKFWNLRQCALAAILMACFSLPWMTYQKFVDPPGNRLLKMHLAGVFPIDSRSSWKAIKDAYSSHSTATLLRLKLSNLATLVGPAPRFTPNATEAARIAQRDYILGSLGILNIGWLAALVAIARKRTAPALPGSKWMILASLLNLIVWALVLFGPNRTMTAQSSYADILLLSLGLLGYLLTLPRLAIVVALAAQILNFVFLWVLFKPTSFILPSHAVVAPAVQWPLLTLGVCCALALLWHLGESYLEVSSRTRTSTNTSN